MTPWTMVRNGSCRRVRRRMSARLDGDLPAALWQKFDRHLASCGHCRRIFGSLRATVADIARLADEPSPLARSIADEVVARIESGGRPSGHR